ncbi:hypothetical protein COCCADRAFT_88960 [Bipolaris zeicola 26-R-13]|uniref:Uncharacterized protein n=1 Tax=Cochliobolus carbonum (strain 26-R-13) TaxID=930089 RepID=W6YX86_COCC2|nr:uncharacterized protein COCCADRAFT_88960 [Bipolaris zeicola 26-R-13]EUC36121.1 hypothetical protein COCCADRAFT_88960 [Bipolaris zeicola 26-R-13]
MVGTYIINIATAPRDLWLLRQPASPSPLPLACTREPRSHALFSLGSPSSPPTLFSPLLVFSDHTVLQPSLSSSLPLPSSHTPP